ncbi:MAG TPA: lysophospholipid acyltransferase family protein [Polyangiales bacterium]|nr:lysophospholipid acyltransferase family protein [Polyangiales bacterium]
MTDEHPEPSHRHSKSEAEAGSPPSAASALEIPQPSERLLSYLGTANGHKALSWIIDYFDAKLEGKQHIPREGGALIVSNHALFALDTAVLAALIIRDLGRNPRFLADRKLWEIPGLHQFITAIGALPGEPIAAVELLRRGELVVVYPGGVDDSLKLTGQRYQLQWKSRAGFARVALRAQAPIIPVVGLGIDEMYAVPAREHLLGRRIFGSTRYDLPFFFGRFGTVLPRPVEQTYIALPPITALGDPNSPDDVERTRFATYEAIESRLRLVR